jgi:hypothetical protein
MRCSFLTGRLLILVVLTGALAAGAAVGASAGSVEAQQRAAAQARPQPFSEVERSTLERGGLVVRRKSERRGNQILVGGTSWQVVALPPDAVWRAVLDTPRYTKMLPSCTAARTVELHGERRTIFLSHRSGPMSASYYLSTRARDERRDLTFVLDARRPHSVDAAWGFFTVRPYGEGKSLLSYGLMADYGDGFLGGLVRQRLHAWSLRVPATMKEYLEGSGRSRYLPAERLRGAPGLPREERGLPGAAEPAVGAPVVTAGAEPRAVPIGAVATRTPGAGSGSTR